MACKQIDSTTVVATCAVVVTAGIHNVACTTHLLRARLRGTPAALTSINGCINDTARMTIIYFRIQINLARDIPELRTPKEARYAVSWITVGGVRVQNAGLTMGRLMLLMLVA